MEKMEKKMMTKEEKKERNKIASRNWYYRQTPEEKQKRIKEIMETNKGICEICDNDRLYTNLSLHKKSQMHKKRVEKMAGKK